MVAGPDPERVAQVAERVGEIAADYRPPDFAEVPGPDAALFLSAIDHGTGYEGAHEVGGERHEGSALLWALGIEAERESPGTLSAEGLAEVGEAELGQMFGVGGEVVAGPGERARLWRGLSAGLADSYHGSAAALIEAAGGRLAGRGGMLERLAAFEAYADPLQKKSLLFCKIAERRGWLEVADPESWEVCADSVLMRLALRAGLVDDGPVEEVRAATRDAFAAVAAGAGISPPLLDDLLWELGREDADLLGAAAGDLREPNRPPGGHFY